MKSASPILSAVISASLSARARRPVQRCRRAFVWIAIGAATGVGLAGCASTSPQTTGSGSGADAIDCSQREEAWTPVRLSPEALAARYGSGATRFSELGSSKDRPVEVCLPAGEANYLMGLQCDDGGRPFSNVNSAKLARKGSVGAGGRCESIIDLYEVRCREGVYEVYMDMYMCPAD